MSKQGKTNLILLAVVAVLVAITVFEPGKAPEQGAQKPPLLDMGANAIEQLRIERPAKEAIVIERSGSGWRMLEPKTLPVADFRIDKLLSLTELEVESRFPLSELEEGAQLGLDTPGVTLTLNGETTLKFGGQTPLGYNRYVQIGDTVYTVADRHYHQLNGDYASFADRRLLPEGSRPIGLQSEALTIGKDSDGHWQVNPQPEDYSPDQVAALFDAWRYNQAYQVTAADGEAKGETITVALKGEQPLQFTITQRSPDLLLQRNDLGLVYHFAAEAREALLTLKPLPETDSDYLQSGQ